MNRRDFIHLGIAGGMLSTVPGFMACTNRQPSKSKELAADLVIAGGGLGGFSAALGALRNGLNVILTEETDWIGGQLTSQGSGKKQLPSFSTALASVIITLTCIQAPAATII